MKVILQKDVKNLGKEGEVVETKEGYARNFLFPKKLAVEANKKNLELLKEDLQEQKKEALEELAEAEKTKEALEKVKLVLAVKSGEQGRLFGAVTTKDIVKDLKQKHNIQLDKRKIELKENIKSLGTYNLKVKLHPEVSATLSVQVIEA